MPHSSSHRSRAELEAGFAEIQRSPRDQGTLELIVRRPDVDEREVLEQGHLDASAGLIGDNHQARSSSKTADGSAHPDMQLNVMNARVIELVAGSRDRWPLAGDQLYVDLDLSNENLPVGARLSLGGAIIEVTAFPHTGCRKFKDRYGEDAVAFVNSPVGRQLRLRGLNARVVQPGPIHSGDVVRRIDP